MTGVVCQAVFIGPQIYWSIFLHILDILTNEKYLIILIIILYDIWKSRSWSPNMFPPNFQTRYVIMFWIFDPKYVHDQPGLKSQWIPTPGCYLASEGRFWAFDVKDALFSSPVQHTLIQQRMFGSLSHKMYHLYGLFLITESLYLDEALQLTCVKK